MAYSVSDLTTKAACDAVLIPLGRERDAVANRRSNLAFQLENFGNAAALQAEVTRLTASRPPRPTLPPWPTAKKSATPRMRSPATASAATGWWTAPKTKGRT
ncbi:hypothetical protein [Hymenobacter sp.]|uniref:hypothetical protein n=1 Tax=Hymenobacter sp. TaxID=1898978 RepID=UPI00286CE7A5|nr:hypothetical protein [Hymenobacter sp.]